MDGRPVGTADMLVCPMTAAEYQGLRYLQRRSEPPTTIDLRQVQHETSLPAPMVDRRNPINVVLTDVVPGEPGPTVRLSPAFQHRGMFDHDYDHHPGMVMLEGARQYALLAARTGGMVALGSRLTVTDVRAQYLRFAELDAPVLLSMPEAPAWVDRGVLAVPVQVRQGSEPVAETTCRLRVEAA
jgi:hypothetical protein